MFIFELFLIFTKSSVEHKTSVNNSNAYHTIVQRKKFVELPELVFFQIFKRDRDDSEEKIAHSKITDSVLLETNLT